MNQVKLVMEPHNRYNLRLVKNEKNKGASW